MKMLEDLAELVMNDKDVKESIKSKITDIINSDAFFETLEKNIIETVERTDFDDILYDLIHEEDMFRPMVNSIKKKIEEMI